MDTQETQRNSDAPVERTERKRKSKKSRVTMTDKMVSGSVIISFVGVLCFAALLVVMLVIKI